MEESKIKQLYLAKDYIEANIIKSMLSEINIDSYLFGNNLQVGIGGIPIDSTFTKVFVSENNFVNASKFIQKYKNNLLQKETKMWTCLYCEELSPTTLTVCWNCGKEK